LGEINVDLIGILYIGGGCNTITGHLRSN